MHHARGAGQANERRSRFPAARSAGGRAGRGMRGRYEDSQRTCANAGTRPAADAGGSHTAARTRQGSIAKGTAFGQALSLRTYERRTNVFVSFVEPYLQTFICSFVRTFVVTERPRAGLNTAENGRWRKLINNSVLAARPRNKGRAACLSVRAARRFPDGTRCGRGQGPGTTRGASGNPRPARGPLRAGSG